MSTKTIKNGVWPTMITPFTEEGVIDYAALEKLIDWYIEHKVDGLFAVCQSSEMFFLSLKERLELVKASVRFAKGRVPVIASGHVADAVNDQIEEAKMMADTGVDAVVLLTNRFARYNESDDVFISNLERFLSGMKSDTLLGFYECPAPYKRLLTPSLMKFAVQTGRFGFMKDTSCRIGDIREKLSIIKGTNFKLFNANAATFLESLRAGASGYSGIMTNFHAELYAWLCANWEKKPKLADELQDFLGLASVIEYQLYPANAMYALQHGGLPIKLSSRRVDTSKFTESMKLEVDEMMRLSHIFSARYANL
jgi:4-hydroxy-tetrahydrodipicolinate synthase